MTTSEWADEHRVITSDTSPEPGPWETDRVPYLREMMDVLDDPRVWKAVYMLGVQLGKTEVLLNRIGKNIHLDPAPMLFSFPDDEALRDFSKDRVLPMLEASKPLRERVIDRKKKTSGDSTIKGKRFPGGYLAMVSAKSATSFASRAIRDLFMDEIDRYGKSAGKEGDPISLATRRTTNFWNRKIALASSPGNKEDSHIAPEYEVSDKRKWFCPCPHCDSYQVIDWKNVQWDKTKGENGEIVHHPETARLVCLDCGCLLDEIDRIRMVKAGEWRATAPFNGVAGFHASSLISLFTSLGIIVREWIEAQDDQEKLKAFINTRLAQLWENKGMRLDDEKLFKRNREAYGHGDPEVPDGVLILTCGVDVQDDRLEVEIKGWGLGEESWGICYRVFRGDPGEPKVWQQLEDLLYSKFHHKSGLGFSISCTCIDSGGHHTQMVYDFCKNQAPRPIFAIKGQGGEGVPIVGAPAGKRSGKDERKVELFHVGVDDVKTRLYSRLRKHEAGPGYFHFPAGYTEEYFKQLTAEECIYEDGKRKWRKLRPRNEALDVTVYAYAALQLVDPTWPQLKERIDLAIKNEKPAAKPQQANQGRRIRHEGVKL